MGTRKTSVEIDEELLAYTKVPLTEDVLSAREEWTVSATEKRPSLRSRSGAKCFEAFSVGARA